MCNRDRDKLREIAKKLNSTANYKESWQGAGKGSSDRQLADNIYNYLGRTEKR